MPNKLEAFPLEQGGKVVGMSYWFLCPGCGFGHRIDVTYTKDFNGDLELPSFSSILHFPQWGCHFYIRRGRIEFTSLSTHAKAGQTLDLRDL